MTLHKALDFKIKVMFWTTTVLIPPAARENKKNLYLLWKQILVDSTLWVKLCDSHLFTLLYLKVNFNIVHVEIFIFVMLESRNVKWYIGKYICCFWSLGKLHKFHSMNYVVFSIFIYITFISHQLSFYYNLFIQYMEMSVRIKCLILNFCY